MLTFESDGVATGEYADVVSEAVNDASISVPEPVHARLADRFVDVRYQANIVPEDGSTPANGRHSKEGINALTVGGTAVVDSSTRAGDEGAAVSHLEIHDATSREIPPAAIRVSRYDWDERADAIRRDA